MTSPVETLAAYVPQLIVRRFIDQPEPLTKPATEHFFAAVLFADISGFTALTERLSKSGLAGAEQVSALLNDYFGQMIDLVSAHGGDVVKFAGDALLALWPAAESDQDRSLAVQRAADCALRMQQRLHNYTAAKNVQLSMRMGLSAGDITLAHIGGVNKRWEFIVAGSPLLQLRSIKQVAVPGDVVLSPQAWTLVQDRSIGQPLDSQDVRVEQIDPPAAFVLQPDRSISPQAEAALRAYIPFAALSRLDAGQTGWLAELRRVSVIFLNLPELNYTASLSQAQQMMSAMQTTLYHFEGSINKLSVDDQGVTLLAALGLPPLSHEDDAARAVQAALGMQSVANSLGLRSSIGITTGQIFCGLVGNDRRREYTIVGDIVNLSTRLMQSAPGDIRCDAATMIAAQARLKFEALTPIMVKGKTEPVAIYRPLGELTTSDRTATAISHPSTQIETVGRATERSVLYQRLDSLVVDGLGGVVIIEGEPGIGKSRLVSDALQRAQALQVPDWIVNGDAIESATPYYAWRSVFSQLFGLEAAGDVHTRRQLVLSRLQTDPDLLGITPLLNAVLPLDFPDNEYTEQLTGQSRADSTRHLLLSLLINLTDRSARSPRLLVLEDAHWLDSASWACAELLSREVPSLLTVISLRPINEASIPEYRAMRQMPNTQVLQLGPLTSDDSMDLVCRRLGVNELPAIVRALILEKAEGHPFYSEELAYALRDAGLIVIADGQCTIAPTAGDLRALNLPDTVQGVIISRIDRLTPAQQLTLKVASVIGRVFAYRVLHDVHPIEDDRPHIVQYLSKLEQLDITPLETPEPELAYIFKHAITQDVAYNLMLFAQRRQLHQAVAEWYERVPLDDRSSYIQLLAHHWLMADQPEKAIGYLSQAAKQAARVGANAEAKALYLQALDSLRPLAHTPDRQRQFIDLAIGLGRVGAYLPSENILENLKLALAAAESLQEETALARVLGSLGAYHYVLGRLSEAQDHFAKSMTLAEKLGLEELLLLPYNVIGRTLAVAGDFPKAAPLLAKGIALAEKFHDDELLAGSLGFYASTFWFQGQRAAGLSIAERGLAVAERSQLPSRIAGNLMSFGFVETFGGFFAEAEQYLDRCLSIAEPQHFIQPMYIAYGCKGYLAMLHGDLDRARRYLDDGLKLATTNKLMAFLPMQQAHRAELALAEGALTEALKYAEAACTLGEKTRQRMSLGEAQRVLGKVYTHTQTWDKAEQALKASLELQRKCNALPFVALSLMDFAQLDQARGSIEQARASNAEAIDLFEKLGMVWQLDRARQLQVNLTQSQS
jgi:class 3 adenylate cyclase/tetratricopeptide (TPR) repeat protein